MSGALVTWKSPPGDLARAIAPRVVEAFEDAARHIIADAREVWPQDTGLSERSFYYETKIADNKIKTSIDNSAQKTMNPDYVASLTRLGLTPKPYKRYAYYIVGSHDTTAKIRETISAIEARPVRRGWGEYQRERALEKWRTILAGAESSHRDAGLSGKNLWHELVRKPFLAEGKRLAPILADDLAALAGRS